MFGGLFGKKPKISISIDGNPTLVGYRDSVTQMKLPAFVPGDKVTGKLSVKPVGGKAVSHQGITLTLFADYLRKDRSRLSRFFERTQHLAPAGDLSVTIDTNFTFDKLSFPASSYYGQTFDLVYGVELRIVQRMKDRCKVANFLVFVFDDVTENNPIHNEIGMENLLHIEFIFPNTCFDCHAVVTGAAYLVLVKLRIVHMQVSLYASETYGYEGAQIQKRTILKTAEIMDGPPCRGDHVPIRFYLGDCDVWPFTPCKDSRAKVEFYLRAQMTDENGKRYHKQLRAEIVRFRPK